MVKQRIAPLCPHAQLRLSGVQGGSEKTDDGPKATQCLDYGHTRRPNRRCTHDLYRLSCAQYDAMRDRAQDRCEICGVLDRETPRGQLVIDHFEARGVFFVRGLLCDRCNSVMQRHDRSAPWGPRSLPFADKARAYHLNAFGEPGPDRLRRADEAIRNRRNWSEGRHA
ncbi:MULTISPECIES: endonuclease domain-containing protein [unclassified Streptomyces]|uniref:endonuclease domain-containing protein n=1 Tax=unclassified Streptomyces TaxID=2593676 RepID=UPI001319ED90|nr:endonuclease domain-containing protein [Streptomyces sp. BoleA5]MYX33444.1 hypothetical protein [Streptomyces sp. SID8377]